MRSKSAKLFYPRTKIKLVTGLARSEIVVSRPELSLHLGGGVLVVCCSCCPEQRLALAQSRIMSLKKDLYICRYVSVWLVYGGEDQRLAD